MAVIRYDIKNGVRLNVIRTDKFKTNYISVNFLTSLEAETAAKKALLPQVLKRGTQSYPDMAAMTKYCDMLYATYIGTRNYKRGETQIFGFCANMLDNKYVKDGTDILGGTLSLIREIIFRPVLENGIFRTDYVESEKVNLADAIRAKINNKNSYAIWRCQEEMCRGEKFAVQDTGTADEVMAITPKALYDFYLDVINHSAIEIFFVGSCDEEALVGALRELFAPIQCAADFVPSTEIIRSAGEVREFTEDQPVTQGKLSMGFRTGMSLSDSDYHKFIMFVEIYGGSPSAKLFMNVREKYSLCYYCSARPEALKGIMIVASGIEVSNKQKAQDEILVQLDAMKNGDFTDEEINSAKISLKDSYRSVGDSAESYESWYIGRLLAGIDTSPEEASAMIDTVSREDIIEAARGVTLDIIYFLNGTKKPDSGDGEESGDDE